MPDALRPLAGRFWRMLNVRWQHRPFDSGAHLTGGRWNPQGTPALYLSADYNTAIQEMHQNLIRPGTLVAFDLVAGSIADLTTADSAITACPWREIFLGHKGTPPTWPIAEQLIAAGADGALVPSVQNRGGINLVLWRWHDAQADGASGTGQRAALTLLDPDAALTNR